MQFGRYQSPSLIYLKHSDLSLTPICKSSLLQSVAHLTAGFDRLFRLLNPCVPKTQLVSLISKRKSFLLETLATIQNLYCHR